LVYEAVDNSVDEILAGRCSSVEVILHEGNSATVLDNGSGIPIDPMLDPKQLEDLAARLASVIPPGLRNLRGELEENFRVVLRANLERFDLVSRERFDVQAELLARTTARLKALEERLVKLERDAAKPEA